MDEKEDVESHLTDKDDDPRFPVVPQRFVADTRRAMPSDGIICLDNGIYKVWYARNYKAHLPNTLLLDNALATMGAGLPSAMIQLVYHMNPEDGLRLVQDSRLAAVAFTGSRRGGLALKAAADEVGKPIYLELSSVNPVDQRLGFR